MLADKEKQQFSLKTKTKMKTFEFGLFSSQCEILILFIAGFCENVKIMWKYENYEKMWKLFENKTKVMFWIMTSNVV